MTFVQWCLQTTEELDSIVPKEFVTDIMTTAIRVALEEFSANPAEADLDIGCIGRFYLNHRKCHRPKKFVDANEGYRLTSNGILEKREISADNTDEYDTRWEIKFRPSPKLKSVINNKCPMDELLIAGHIPLYPEKIMNPDGLKKRLGRGRPRKEIKLKKKWIVQLSPEYRRVFKEMKELKKLMEIQGKLPKEEENVQRKLEENPTREGNESTGVSRQDNSL